jgi:hypothetical protein
MQTQDDVRQRYQDALDSLIEKVEQDRLILAAILCGSLSHDQVWEKSDIDLVLVGTEEFKEVKDFGLVEEGVNIHAIVYPRSKFKAELEKAVQSSFFHSYISKSTLLFTKDPTLQEYYDNIQQIGSRDREIQLLRAGNWVLPTLAKAEKWLYVKKDPAYSFKWIMATVDSLASIEVIMNGEVTGREVIQQALKFNPDFFNAIYADLIYGKIDEAAVRDALRRINDYMDERLYLLFGPILEYLSEEGAVRSTTELDAYFNKRAHTGGLSFAYEWLADKGVIQKVSTPVRLSEKSRVTVNEAAYYYDGGEF